MMHRSVVEADHFQFVLADPSGAILSGPPADLPLVRFDLESAEFVSVLTGAQWGPVGVSSVCLDAEPASIGDRWEEVAEISVSCGTGLNVRELMGEQAQTLCSQGGTYRLRISALGRADAADLDYDELIEERDDADLIEEYLIEAWPAPISDARMLRTRDAAAAHPANEAPPGLGGYDEYDEDGQDQRRDAAEAAGQRVGVDLDQAPGARLLSGQFGAATLTVVLPREIKRVWPLIAYLDITNMSAPSDAAVGNEFSMSTYDPDEDGYVGTNGQIVCQWTELDEPTRVGLTWRWTGTARQVGATTLTAALTDRSTDPDKPRTELALTHTGLPLEWVEDMTTIWRSKVDMWFYQARPRKRRR